MYSLNDLNEETVSEIFSKQVLKMTVFHQQKHRLETLSEHRCIMSYFYLAKQCTLHA